MKIKKIILYFLFVYYFLAERSFLNLIKFNNETLATFIKKIIRKLNKYY